MHRRLQVLDKRQLRVAPENRQNQLQQSRLHVLSGQLFLVELLLNIGLQQLNFFKLHLMFIVSCLLIGFDVFQAVCNLFFEMAEFLQIGILPLGQIAVSLAELSV